MRVPKQALHPMHLLASIRENGIGQLGFALPDTAPSPAAMHMERRALMAMPFTHQAFDELVDDYLLTGPGIAGVQPKLMLADRAGVSIPTVIVKAAPLAYAGLAANEFLCLSAARRAGIVTPSFDLSNDGHMLVVNRFDLQYRDDRIERLGFEDVASVMGLRVRDALAERKYQGSYQRIAELLRSLGLPFEDLHRFFEQVALSVMVRNGDAHLKNFGVLVPQSGRSRLSPVFDVVTTAIYSYTRFAGDVEQTDRSMALKLFAGRRHTKAYPTTEELLHFGTEVCGVHQPATVLARIAEAMHETLTDAKGDARIPASLLARMEPLWQMGMQHARTASSPPLSSPETALRLLRPPHQLSSPPQADTGIS
jgi:serine/threonine-protein kinase HipA